MKNFSFFLQVILTIIAICFAFFVGWISNDGWRQIEGIGEAMDNSLTSEISSVNREETTKPDVQQDGEVLSDIDNLADLRVLETTDQIKAYITEVSERYGIKVALAIKIAEAESYPQLFNTCHCDYGQPHDRTCVENCQKGISIYKIVQSTFDEQCEGDVYNIKDNIDCGILMMSKSQYWRWEKSVKKWGSEYWKLELFEE